jgi:hypothetical protein
VVTSGPIRSRAVRSAAALAALIAGATCAGAARDDLQPFLGRWQPIGSGFWDAQIDLRPDGTMRYGSCNSVPFKALGVLPDYSPRKPPWMEEPGARRIAIELLADDSKSEDCRLGPRVLVFTLGEQECVVEIVVYESRRAFEATTRLVGIGRWSNTECKSRLR